MTNNQEDVRTLLVDTLLEEFKCNKQEAERVILGSVQKSVSFQ